VSQIVGNKLCQLLKAEISDKSDVSNLFYGGLVAHGFGEISEYGQSKLNDNDFQLLYNYQQEAKKEGLGFWKLGELERKELRHKAT
jgi:hypothetical protein